MVNGRLTERNEAISEMLSDGEQLKNFYRFIAQNPHINLHDACQIIVERPNATVCFSFNEWAAMDRRITKGRKGIAYYDNDGYKQFVFDANDTHGDNRYSRPILPMKRLLGGLDELNGTDLTADERSDYRKIHKGVQLYLKEQDALSGDAIKDKLLIDGVTYSLYAKTGFPKSAGIPLSGLPYSYVENAEFVKDVYIRTDMLVQDIEEAYSDAQEKADKINVVNDIDDEAVSDEPIIPVGQTETKPEEHSAAEPKHPLSPMYEQYMKAQNTMPNAVVLMRLGDFYEVLGEKAKIVADELNLTLTGREVGLPERVPMCGMPYHAMDVYLDKILVHHGVLLVEPNEEPKYILSHAEALEQEAEAKEEKTKPTLTEMPNDEPTPFDDEQSETDDWRSELAAELGDTDDGQSEDIGELDDDEEEIDDQDYDEAEDIDDDESDEQTEQGSESKDEVKSTPKKKEKGIKDRKRREKPQLSMFDLLDPKAQSAEEALIEQQLKIGSRVEHGKFRIFDKYQENPTLKTFAEFLKNEYGWGGAYVGSIDEMHDAKGIHIKVRDKENPQNNLEVNLKWPEVATRIADLIDDDNYLSEQEKKEYVGYKAEQNRLREQRLEQERRRDKFLEKILTDEPRERKERIEEAYHNAESTEEFISFVKQEYGAYTTKELEGQSIVFNDYGVFVSENGDTSDMSSRYSASWTALEKKFAALINANSYIEPNPQPEQLDDEEDWDALIDARAFNPIEPEQPQVTEESENTDLNGVLDQNELGGAKTRFRNNVAAIKLVNKLYAENRNATDAEKKVLSQFVGWGGLSQAFDENNPQWAKEYAELKGLLSTEDYEQAKSSTLNAYYTAKDVIGGIYAALGRFGVKGNNRILEPSMGTGNFFGFMPQTIADGSRLYGVELDNLTGRIAAKLYPQANVQIKGFEDTSFPDDKFDIVVGNVPFGGYGVADSAYNRYNFKVHDYFLAKSIDKVKPGGIVAIVTSKGTMEKLNRSARKYVAERAKLLGAIRLPNTAFKQTAGTEAVADILFFRKRTEKINADAENIEWLGTGKTEEGYEINNYFIKHPEMVLGTLAEETGLYGGKDVTVKPDGRELSVALNEAVKNLPQGFYLPIENKPIADEKEVDYNVKPMCYKADSGRLYMRVGDEMVEQRIPAFPKDAYQRLQGMIALREELHRILDVQIKGCSDEVLAEEQKRLNAMYDTFVKKYGELNGQTNTRLFKDDGDAALLFACEDIDKETKKASKAEIFYKRTIRPYIVPTNTDDPFEALQISKNERGGVDIAYIEELTGKDYDTVLFELGDAVFRNPKRVKPDEKYSGFETAEEYLSGRVVDKLGEAEYYAEQNPEYKRNVTALEQVQPTKLTATEISARLGATWIDKDFYKQFYCELVGVYWWKRGDVELFYNPFDSSWRLDQKDSVRADTQMKQKEVYGTKRAPAYRLFIDAMNMRATTIYDTIVDADGRERRILNQPETIAAREKQNQIKEMFTNWIYSKPERREELEATYNRLFNQIRLPSYDGSYLKFPEMNPAIELNPHQKNAVHRIITSPESTLLHHVVGSGKTYTMVASIMKMRQLGICKKAMVAVPNHLVEQWAGEWRKLYPNAKILVATKEDLEKDNRQRFVSKVAMGDWDGIIIAQSSFAKIPISQERQIKKLRQEIKLIEETVHKQWEENGMPRGAVKNLERIKKSREAMLKKLMDGNKKDDVLTFENLGVDYLYIDEAHYYKNLFLFTKMNNVAGVSNAASQRASDLKLKCEYLQELHGSDKGVVFGTGTPISNSMSEMYTMQNYLQPSALRGSGIEFFDGWAADFGETITSMELSPSGQGYRARTRFAKFTNLPELLTMYRSFADVQTQDMVKLNVPEAEKHVISLKPSDTTIELAEQIAERAEKIHDRQVSPEEDNMLKITSDGKKLALDPRCFVPDSEDEAGSKLNEAAQRIYEIWQDTSDRKGTQIVFCDLSTPKKRFEDYVYGTDFDAYNDLKYKLVQKGIPKDEIAFIHDATSEEQKQDLFDSVNSGAVRVLIGSTEKCGAGTNVQKRLVALHHLDTPYRPSDMEQREGRIIRQGNENKKVDIYTYVTERTFDSYSYQILENKQKFISQINKGDLTVREAEDIDETTLSYAEIKAITAANPKIKKKMEVDAEISRLRVLEGQYKKNLYELQDKILKDFPEDIRKQELLIERVSLDLMHLQASKPEDPEAFEISVNGKVYADRKEGGKALTEALYKSKPETVVAEYCGFKISMNPISILTATEREITLTANGQYTMRIGESASGNLTRLDNFIEEFPARKERLENRLKQLKDDLEVAKEQVQKSFEHKERLFELLNEQTALNAELDLDKKDEVIVADDGEDDDNYRALPIQRELREEKIIDEQLNERESYYENEVIKSVKEEYDKFYAEMLHSTPQEILNNNYKIHLYNEFSEVIQCGTEYLTDKEFEALYEDRGHILYSLYDDYIGAENYSVETYGETAMFIKDYCEMRRNQIADDKFNAEYEARQDAAMTLKSEYESSDNIIKNNMTDAEEVRSKTQKEYDEYVLQLKEKSPEEIIKLSRRTDFYNRVNTAIQENDEILEPEHFKAINQEEHILQELYTFYTDELAFNFESDYSIDTIGDIAEVIEDFNEENHYDIILEYGEEEQPTIDYDKIASLYLQTALYANEHNEMSDYRNSHKANENCKHGIDEAVRVNFDGMHLNDGFEKKLIDEYGMERVAFVVATTINEHEWDGRYSRTNKDWAKTIPMSESEDERSNCILNVHPAVLDGFADRIREKQTILYTTLKEENQNGQPSYNAYSLDKENGEVKFLLGDFSSDLALQATVDQDAASDHKGYVFKRIEPQELNSMSEKIKAKYKDKEDKMAQDKYLHFTARGDRVLSIVKDRDDRNIAIIQREKMGDYVVAARYDTTDGTWGAGKYNLPTLEAAERYRTEKYGFENTSDTIEKKWLTCKVSPEALIKKYQFNSRFMMPQGSGYEGYAYSIFNDRIKEGTITTDLQSDTRERALVIRIPDNQNVELKGNGKTVEIDPHEFVSLVNETTSDKYEREQFYTVGFPPEAFIKEYEASMLLAMPNDTKYKGYVYYLPKSVISEDKYSDDGTLIAYISESFKVTLRKGEEKIELTAKEYLELVGDKKADRYNRTPSELDEYRQQQGEDDKKWNTVKISENAVIANYKETTLFKMPKGDYAGFVYYMPSGMVRKEDDGLYLRVPEDFIAHLKGGDEKKDLSAQELIAAIEGKTDEDYESVYRKPSEEAIKRFEKVEGQLRKNVPAEMLNKSNWVVVRTRNNAETGRLDKFLINPHTGDFAESDNPETWADFDTACKYAKENGGVCLAYALEWDSDIACIDLDGCMAENGDFSDIAQKAFIAANGSYAEKSVSGKGLHIFGKTKGADLRSFSKDKTMEYYHGGHFIAMTGDNYGSSELKSFDTPMMMNVLESKLEKRTEWKHTGEGVEGLSAMDDREMLEKAFKAKNGDTVKRLYNGEDLRNNHSNSDMSLMNYLAFWSNHDIDQMLRVFATSGLYRADKPQSYYEHTAIKAVKGTPCYTPPKASNGNKPSGNGNGSDKGGK